MSTEPENFVIQEEFVGACLLLNIEQLLRSGDGGGIDMDTICAKLCSSSRKLEMEWQQSTQKQVLHNLTGPLADRPQSQGTYGIP